MPLFKRLSDVLDITGTEIARRCGLRQQVLSRYTTNESVVSIQVLLHLCNSIRMPMYYFVAENNNFVIPNRESATIPLDDWQPVSWNENAVEDTFGDTEGHIKWKDVAIAMHASSQKPHERFCLRTRFKVTDFFTACNAFNLSPFLFINDPNRPSGKAHKRVPTPPTYNALELRVGKLEKEIAELKLQLSTLQRDYEQLLGNIAADR